MQSTSPRGSKASTSNTVPRSSRVKAIFERARDAFDFRLLDVVAVKGKSDAITIYELLGNKGEAEERREIVAAYETAFAAYASARFRKRLWLSCKTTGATLRAPC